MHRTFIVFLKALVAVRLFVGDTAHINYIFLKPAFFT